jgi:REP element-mobilizing transposase RayT
MPDHIHVILYPHRKGDDVPVDISILLQSFKKHVGFFGKEWLREYWREHRQLWSAPLNGWAMSRKSNKSIWNKRGYDFNICDHHTLIEKLDYCHQNPIRKEFVDQAEDWPWSSYRFYELGDASRLPMDWDGAWPIIW